MTQARLCLVDLQHAWLGRAAIGQVRTHHCRSSRARPTPSLLSQFIKCSSGQWPCSCSKRDQVPTSLTGVRAVGSGFWAWLGREGCRHGQSSVEGTNFSGCPRSGLRNTAHNPHLSCISSGKTSRQHLLLCTGDDVFRLRDSTHADGHVIEVPPSMRGMQPRQVPPEWRPQKRKSGVSTSKTPRQRTCGAGPSPPPHPPAPDGVSNVRPVHWMHTLG